MLSARNGTDLYARLENGRASHAFGMSRKFMAEKLSKIENRMTGADDAELLVIDQWFNHRYFPDCSMWFSRKPVFVQRWDKDSKCDSKIYDMFYDMYSCSSDEYGINED